MRRPRLRMIVFIATGLAAIAVTSAAAGIPGGDGTVEACVGNDARTSRTGLFGPQVTLDREGTLRAVDAEAGEECRSDEQPLAFNVEGRPGEPGPQGPQGEPGPATLGQAHIVQREEFLEAGERIDMTVPCELNQDVALGGGYTVTPEPESRNVEVRISRPHGETEPIGWLVSARSHNTAGTPGVTLIGHAICAPIGTPAD